MNYQYKRRATTFCNFIFQNQVKSVFIPTFPLEERVRLVEGQDQLEKLQEDSTDIFEHGLLEHYCNRPDSLETQSLAEFAANYSYSTTSGPNALPLKTKDGYLRRRTKIRIIRYRNYELDPDNYIREHVMLYLPWRDEKKDILDKDLEEVFKSNEKKISKIKMKFNSFADTMLHTALEEAMLRTEVEDDEQCDKSRPVFDFDTYTINDPFTFADIETEFPEDAQRKNWISFTSPGILKNSEYQGMFEMLNQDQRDYVMHVAHHFQTSNDQLLHFLTGGAGVGKSLVIKTLYQTLFRILNSSPDTNPDDPKILLCAPTGKASFNIGGQTIHSAFKLPLNQKQLNELSASISNTLSTKLHALKVIIIDEISMVGQHILDMVDQRLRQLKGINQKFGGVSVVACGDFFQLKPVCARPLYYPTANNPYSEIFGQHLWQNFKTFQLRKIMRQNEKPFQRALNNLAQGKLTSSDIKLFNSRTFPSLPTDEDLHDAIHLFARNGDVDTFNSQVLRKMKGEGTICTASDVLQGHGSHLARRQLLYSVSKCTTQQTMGIPKDLTLKVGAIYMMTYNVNTDDGLCNGATGTLKKIDFGEEGGKKPLRLWVKFDEPSVGSALRNKNHARMQNLKIPSDWTPIEHITVTIRTRKNCSLKINRKQYPLTVDHALSVHKSQGQSLKKVVVHLQRKMHRQLLWPVQEQLHSVVYI